MQKLDVVAKLFPLVLSGEKTSTVRFREQRIQVGPMVYWCEGNSSEISTVWVTRCTDMALSEVTAFLGKTKEWPVDVMLEDMRVHYAGIQLKDIVQVIEHCTPDESLPYLAEAEAKK